MATPDGHLVARHPRPGHRPDGRERSKLVLHPRFQVAIDKAASRAGKRAYNDYIEEWRQGRPGLRRRPRGRGHRRGRAARGRLRQAPPRRADPDRRRRRWPALAPAHDETPKRADGRRAAMTGDPHRHLLRHPRGRHRRRPAVRDHRRADQPDRPEAARRGDEGRRLQPGRARHDRPGRGRRPHARRQRRHPPRRRAGDPRPDHPARPVADRRAALDRLLDRRGARGRLAVYQGKALSTR